MSQEKVEQYKKEKANRKKNMKKEKLMDVVRRIVLYVVAIALVVWLGYSGYSHYRADIPRPTTEIDYSSIVDYMGTLE